MHFGKYFQMASFNVTFQQSGQLLLEMVVSVYENVLLEKITADSYLLSPSFLWKAFPSPFVACCGMNGSSHLHTRLQCVHFTKL